MQWLENKVFPVAAKLGQQKHLVAIRDAFALITPLIIAGAFAVLLVNVVFNSTALGSLAHILNITMFDTTLVPVALAVFNGSFGILSVLLAFALGYNLSLQKGESKETSISAGVLALATSVASMNWAAKVAIKVSSNFEVVPASDAAAAKSAHAVDVTTGFVDSAHLGPSGLFATIILAIVAVELFLALNKVSWLKVKMPEAVPPAVSKAFEVLFPSILAIFLISGIAFAISSIFAAPSFYDLIFTGIQKPFLALSGNGNAGFAIALFYVFMVHFLWIFGLHGTNIMNGVFSPIYLPLLAENVKAAAAHQTPTHIFAQPFFDSFVFLGGSGGTIGLLFAIFAFSKRADAKQIAKLAIAPGIFQINEPVIFGLPIVLNPTFMIPFIITPIVNLVVAFGATALHLVPVVTVQAPWTTPPVIGAFVATVSVQGAILALALVIIDIAIYTPFVLVSNKALEVEEENTNE